MKRNLKFKLVSAALGMSSLVLSASPARAACPPPTPAQCKDAAYKQTSCGAEASTPGGTCEHVVAMDDAIKSGPYTAKLAVLPDHYDEPFYAYSKPYTYGKHQMSGGSAQYAGREQNAQLTTAVGTNVSSVTDPDAVFTINATTQEKAAWEANGLTVNSCREFVYERYNDWSKFKALTDVEPANDRLTFNLAHSPTQGIWNKVLKSKSGARNLPTISFPTNGVIGHIIRGTQVDEIVDGKSPKNKYAAGFKSLSDGQFATSGAFNAAQKQEVNALMTKLNPLVSDHVVNWTWHDSMNTQLASYTDDELRDMYLKQRSFAELIGERTAIKAEIAAKGLTAELQAALFGIEQSILEALRAANTNGCLTSSDKHCDWSPRLFKDHVESFFAREQEKAFHKCIDNTADDFTQARHATANFPKATTDIYADTADHMEDYFQVVKNFVDTSLFPKDPTTGKPVIGARKADSGHLGNSDIFLDWSYDAGFGVTEIDGDKDTCHANLSVDGKFNAKASAFGFPMDLIDAKAFLGTEESVGKASFYLEILDEEIWNKIDKNVTQDLRFSITKSGSVKNKAEFSQTFTIVAIPVTVTGGVSMEVGAEVAASGGVDGRCEKRGQNRDYILASVKGSVKPFIEADAFATAGAGISGFSAGVRIDLVIVRGELPITADANVRLASNGAVTAKLNFGVKEVFRMLDGKVSLYVDGPLSLDASEELFSWNGPKIEEDLVKWDKTLPLDAIKEAL